MLRAEAAAHPLAAVLQQVGPQSCPTRFNFHCHSTCSDGSLSPEQLAAEAVSIGLEHLAVTDHHGLEAHDRLAETFQALQREGARVPTLWRGVEISCLLEGCLVHVLGLGLLGDTSELEPYLQGVAAIGPALRIEAVIRSIRAAGGLAVLAHPARYRLPYRQLIAAAAELGLDGGEAWYDYTMGPRWQPTPLVCEAIADDLAQRGLFQSCGTDTHGLALHGR